jgi:DNA-binding transcriptional regulator YdaS (Cro superfamily)
MATRELGKLALVVRSQGRRKDWIATRIGVSQATVTRWCNGERGIPPARVRELADLLGVHEEDIVEESVQQQKAGVS